MSLRISTGSIETKDNNIIKLKDEEPNPRREVINNEYKALKEF